MKKKKSFSTNKYTRPSTKKWKSVLKRIQQVYLVLLIASYNLFSLLIDTYDNLSD